MKVHLICNAHLDPVWQWRWEEGCAEALKTFRTAAQLLHEHDRLIFNHNEAVLYRWVQQYDPLLFREIQTLVQEKRWYISGGWYLQPDVNLPGTESIIRHILEGRQFFKDYFNIQPKVAYNFDSFGHSGGLPQILSLAGYRMYIHMRPQSLARQLPSDLYRWRGVDGTEIIALRITVGLYHHEPDNIELRLTEGVEKALKLKRDVPVFWGLGDHGGGATRADLAKIDAFIAAEKRVEIIHSTMEDLYECLKDAAQTAPVVEGDLQQVFSGCYTTLSRIKRRAQESLGLLVQTEALCAAAWWIKGTQFDQAALSDAWRDHLFNDFHDILPGTCTEPAEQDALDQYGKTAETLRRLRMAAIAGFNTGKIQDVYLPVIVMNANPSCCNVPVEVEAMLDYRPRLSGAWHLRLFEANGREVPCQEEQPEALLPFNGWRRKISFFTQLVRLGAAFYRIEVFEGSHRQKEAKPALQLRFNPANGLIDRLNAPGDHQCLSGPLMQPLVAKDEGDSWGTDCWAYREIVGRFSPNDLAMRVIESGPVRTIRESLFTWHHSKIIIHTVTYSNWPVIEYRLRIHWNEERKRLKLSIPTVFKSGTLLCEVPGGAIARPADGQEHVQGRWCMVHGKINDAETGLAVINTGQHGIDFTDGELQISILRSPAYCHEQGFRLGESPARKFSDQGIHDVRLLVTVGDPESLRMSLAGLADWLNNPPVALAHFPVGSWPQTPTGDVLHQNRVDKLDLLSLSPDNIRLLACLPFKEEHALIIRLHETSGKHCRATMKLPFPNIDIRLTFAPFEIKTLRVEQSGKWQATELI